MWAEPAGLVLTPPGHLCCPVPAHLWFSRVHACLLWPLSSGHALLSLAPQLLWGLSVAVVSPGKGVCPWPALPSNLVSRVLLGLSVSWQNA